MNNGGQNDWQNLGGGSWPQDAGASYNQPQGYGAAQPDPQNQPYYPPPNNGVPMQNYQPGPYTSNSATGSDLSGGGQTYHGTMPPDASYSGQPYIQPYNQGYNQQYNQGYNQGNSQQYNQYGVPQVPRQWQRPLVIGAIGIGVVLLILLFVLRSIFSFGFHSFGYYGYGIPWWVVLALIAGVALRVVMLFTRASYRSPVATLMSVISLIFTVLILLIIFL